MVSTTRIVGSTLSDIPVWIQRLLWLDIKGDDEWFKNGFWEELEIKEMEMTEHSHEKILEWGVKKKGNGV